VFARERLAILEGCQGPRYDSTPRNSGRHDRWHCLEIGGGGGSIAEWLCRRVGPSGRVVATDINTQYLQALDLENLEVRAHDIVSDELEQGAFDLVHARPVQFHLSQRQTALKRMVPR
jgi:ubiquinone/menaquinone biosynthesis C-methylase UbiE